MKIIFKFSIPRFFHSVLALWIWLNILLINCDIILLAPIAELNESPERLAQEVVELTNAIRVTNGLPPLKLQSSLSSAALWMANDMARHNYHSHIDRFGRSPIHRCQIFGYESDYVGENIAGGIISSKKAVLGWMRSKGHRKNILGKNYREIGVGYGFNRKSKYVHYWVQNFGKRSEIFPIVINNEQDTTSVPLVILYVYGTEWAEYMRLSNDSINWTDWQIPIAYSQWELHDGTGERTVYLELLKGDEIRRSNDSIYLNQNQKKIND